MICGLFLGLFAQESSPPSENPCPNIVWISVEDMSPWLGCYGDHTVPTPHVDALAARGTRFTRAYANAPVCAPARATLITGCYATAIGAMHMRTGKPSNAALARNPGAYDGIPSYEAVPPPEVRCFPELLRKAGYWCTNSSKTDYQFKAPLTVWDQSGRKAHWKNRTDPDQPFFAVFNLTITHESGTFPGTRRRPEVVNPSKVTVPPYWPDTPVVRTDIARTYDNIAAMDAKVGELVEELKDAGLLETTVIFFFSDHGVGLPRGKRCIYDSGTRVPLVVCRPGGSTSVSHRPVSFVDFAPSVLSFAGIEAQPWMVGRAFAGPHKKPGTGLVFFHADRMDAELDRTRAVADGRYRYVRNYMPEKPRIYPVAYAEFIPMTAEIHALRASGESTPAQWQVVDPGKPAEELYDTAADPHEVENLIANPEMTEVASRLRVALEGWMEETGDLGLLEENEMLRERLQPFTGGPILTAFPFLGSDRLGNAWFTSDTPGASIGWRWKGEAGWRPFSEPFQLESGKTLQAIAHRIGFRPSAVVDYNLSKEPRKGE